MGCKNVFSFPSKLWHGLQAMKWPPSYKMMCKNTLQSQGKLQKCQQSLTTMHLKKRTPPCTIWELSGNHEQPPLSISIMAKTRGEPHAPWDHTHQAYHSIFKPPKTITTHSSNWELQLRRLRHLRRLPKQRPMSWPNPLRRPPQSHYLHRTLPLLDHLFNFCIYLLY